MSAEPVNEPVAQATETADASQADQAPKKKRTIPIHPKVQKQLDALKTKQEKLVEENKALKAQIKQFKSSHSRIRKIPKVESSASA